MMIRLVFCWFVAGVCFGVAQDSDVSLPETLPALSALGGVVPQDKESLWVGFDPRAEPLDTEVLKEWEEDGVKLQVLRYRIGVFKGTKAKMIGVFGYPVDAEPKSLPGLLQIHGGGQYSHYMPVLTNAKRGYATLSIGWAGRISAPGYTVSPKEVQLFWDGATENPSYKLTTDWGALDGYHAPGRNKGNHFPNLLGAEEWTLDPVVSPRNNGWFLCALGARRGLTFLERQEVVDPERLGVYGHSMGGKLTVMTTGADERVKAAAPSCGGMSDRYNDSELFRNTVGDVPYLKSITCPLMFLSPANDFHGRINDLQRAVDELQTDEWRMNCSPHHNHQDTAEYEVATQLWMDQVLKGTFQWPETPDITFRVMKKGRPVVLLDVDDSKEVKSVDVWYTRQGKEDRDFENTKHRYWHHSEAKPNSENSKRWSAGIPLLGLNEPVWVYANVLYTLEKPVTGVGYYYGQYTANDFVLSSRMLTLSPEDLVAQEVAATESAQTLIEDFQGDWRKGWFDYRPEDWDLRTNKLYDPMYKAPENARLLIVVKSKEANTMTVALDDHVAEVELKGGESREHWQRVELSPTDFTNVDDDGLTSWDGIKELRLGAKERLRKARGKASVLRGGVWKGDAPEFRRLEWIVGE